MAPACSAASAAIVVFSAAPAAAQSVARFAVDSAISIDEFQRLRGQDVSGHPQIIIDISAGVRLGDHWQLYVRPWFRLPRPSPAGAPVPDWETELYQAGLRYERSGPIATRMDVGYILSPIGLGILDGRPGLNPTIAPHLSYLIPMVPRFDSSAPAVSAIASTYPLGGQVTVSSAHWDARGAVLNSAPTRIYAVGAASNPGQTAAVVAGAGVTPMTGLRFGVSAAYGHYATAKEVTGPVQADRSVAIVGIEGEYAFKYTKVSGEFLRSSFERSAGQAVAYEWFVQGLQTLSPRWFVAARQESTLAPTVVNTRLDIAETTLGFRVTPEVTLRGSYFTRKFYGASTWDHQVGASVVWARRWW